jgi:hypothetical protein
MVSVRNLGLSARLREKGNGTRYRISTGFRKDSGSGEGGLTHDYRVKSNLVVFRDEFFGIQL